MFDFLNSNLSALKRNRATAKILKAARVDPDIVLAAMLEFEANNLDLLSTDAKVGRSFMTTVRTVGEFSLNASRDLPDADKLSASQRMLCNIIAQYVKEGFFNTNDIDDLSIINLTKMLISTKKLSAHWLEVAQTMTEKNG